MLAEVTRRPPRVVCLTVAVLAGLSGCSAAPGGPVGSRSTASASVGGLSADAVDMVTRSGSWPAAQQTLDTALNELTHTCMRRAGFVYPATKAARPTSPDDAKALVDLPARRRHGYGIASPPPSSGPPPAPYYTELDADRRRRFDLAFSGPPDARTEVGTGAGTVRVGRRGCDAESRARLAGDVVAWARMYYTPEALNGRLDAAVPRQSGYVAALARWRSCMTERGHRYPSPEAAREKLSAVYEKRDRRKSAQNLEFRALERDVAADDGECALASRLPSSAIEARRKLVHSLPEKDRAAITELARIQAAALKRAEAVLADKSRREAR
ncbi:hypothetical protein [Streptomyces flavofungini]|uniref:hypothetical protein n=1 Tax=Streptomyces flavofungini TaxID=68200 RepID=UPI0025B0A1B7|nr:hypothetical protein [Streptomyces flavofungini]WJV50457.1 hypothetical protein QUY26_36105 [Streptomyces flavofungini]